MYSEKAFLFIVVIRFISSALASKSLPLPKRVPAPSTINIFLSLNICLNFSKITLDCFFSL